MSEGTFILQHRSGYPDHAIISPGGGQSLGSEWGWEDEHAQSILLKQPNVYMSHVLLKEHLFFCFKCLEF